jgi:hypothetical protein
LVKIPCFSWIIPEFEIKDNRQEKTFDPLKGRGFVEEIKKRKNVRLIEIDEGRRNASRQNILMDYFFFLE